MGLFNLHHGFINPFRHNVKWPNILQKSCSVNTVRFLKYVWPFYNILHERVNMRNCVLHFDMQVFSLFSLYKLTRGGKSFCFIIMPEIASNLQNCIICKITVFATQSAFTCSKLTIESSMASF